MTSTNTYNVLKNAEIIDNSVFMHETLSPKVWRNYTSKMKTMGGVWDNRTQSHVFERNPKMLVERLLSLGSQQFNKFSLYETPSEVFNTLWDEYLERFFYTAKTVRILEPSVGCGSLVFQLLEKLKANEEYQAKVEFVTYDIDPINVEFCSLHGLNVTQADFLTVDPDPTFDIVLMNPPFSDTDFAKHIEHARKFLTEKGKLFSIVPVAPFSENQKLSMLLDPTSALHSAYQAAIKSNWAFCQEQFTYNAFKGAKVRTTVLEIDNEELRRSNNHHDDQNQADMLFLTNTNKTTLASIISTAINKAESQEQALTLLDFQAEFVNFIFDDNTVDTIQSPQKTVQLPDLAYWASPQDEIQYVMHERFPEHFSAPEQANETNVFPLPKSSPAEQMSLII